MTPLKNRTDSSEQGLAAAGQSQSESSSKSNASSDSEDIHEKESVVEHAPLLAKKQPSPTKIKQPSTGLKSNLTSEEFITPVLQVVCQTPERSQKHLYKYVEGMSCPSQGSNTSSHGHMLWPFFLSFSLFCYHLFYLHQILFS